MGLRYCRSIRILLPLLLACGAAQAADWFVISKFASGAFDQIDSSSILVEGTVRRAWFKYFYPPHSERGTGDNSDKWINFDLSREAFNCAKQNRRTEALHVYFEDGTNFSNVSEEQWRPVPPDSIADDQMKFICAWKPNRTGSH